MGNDNNFINDSGEERNNEINLNVEIEEKKYFKEGMGAKGAGAIICGIILIIVTIIALVGYLLFSKLDGFSFDGINLNNSFSEKKVSNIELEDIIAERENNIFLNDFNFNDYVVDNSVTNEEVNLYPFVEASSELWGYMDDKGVVVIEPQFYYGSDFSDGVASVILDNSSAYINKYGEIILDIGLKYAGDFENGIAEIIEYSEDFSKLNKSTIIDKEGNEIISGKYDYVDISYNGFIVCEKENRSGYSYTYFDRDGNELSWMKKYDLVSEFVNGYAVIADKDYEYFLVDEEYNIIKFKGYEIVDYFNGLIKLYDEKNYEYIYLNKYLKQLTFRADIEMLWFSYDGDKIAYVEAYGEDGDINYFIDYEGNILFESEYKINNLYIDGIASVYYYDKISEKVRYALINNRGEVIEDDLYNAEVLPGNLIKVYNEDDKYGVRTLDGEYIIDEKYQDIYYENNLIICEGYIYDGDDYGYCYDIYTIDGELLNDNNLSGYYVVNSNFIYGYNYYDEYINEGMYINSKDYTILSDVK